jgi:CheY-like chemotaxis protein
MDKNQQPGKKGMRSAPGEVSSRPEPSHWVPVLHVEDDANDRDLLQTAVVEAEVPFQVHTASDAGQAIAFLSGRGVYADRSRFPLPSVILLDIKMRGSTGLEVLNWVRARPELSRVPIIVLSGSESEEDMRTAYASGANGYLVKPLGFNALVEMIKGINLGWFVAAQTPVRETNFSTS